jgi:hypothetical protein
LSAEYGRTIEVYVNPQVPPGPPPTVDALMTEKTRVALVGPDAEMIFLYNATPSAPSIAKDIAGKFVFLTGNVSVCFTQNTMDEDRVWFLERTLRKEGAKDIKYDRVPCDFAQLPTTIDVVAFQRGEFRKRRMEYIVGLLDLLGKDDLREYKVVTEMEYSADVQNIRAVSLQITSDIESRKRAGFGVLVVTDDGTLACAIASNRVADDGLKALLRRDKEMSSPHLRFEWSVVNLKLRTLSWH